MIPRINSFKPLVTGNELCPGIGVQILKVTLTGLYVVKYVYINNINNIDNIISIVPGYRIL